MSDAPLFELDGVAVKYATAFALRDISLRIAPGEHVALVGPSGSGKTTLLRLLCGARRATSGRVFVEGLDTAEISPSDLRRIRADIGFIHQSPSLVPNLRVIQNVLSGRMGRLSFPTSLRQLLFATEAEAFAVHLLLERVGIGEKLYERTDRLSGGQQQRVAIARALYQQPAAILADEPVSNVDPARARDTLRLLRELARRDEQLTLCMSLHNLPFAREFFPRLIGLREGRVVFDRPAGEISDEDFERLYELPAEDEPGRAADA